MGKRRVPQGFMTVGAAAVAIGVSNERIRQLIRDGTLKAHRAPGIKRMYLLSAVDVEAMMRPRPVE